MTFPVASFAKRESRASLDGRGSRGSTGSACNLEGLLPGLLPVPEPQFDPISLFSSCEVWQPCKMLFRYVQRTSPNKRVARILPEYVHEYVHATRLRIGMESEQRCETFASLRLRSASLCRLRRLSGPVVIFLLNSARMGMHGKWSRLRVRCILGFLEFP